MRPDGSFETYDKRHLFRMAKEHERYADGRDKLHRRARRLARVPDGLLRPALPGLDPQPLRRLRAGRFDYDLFVVVANWPAPRRTAWRTLLRARAIENLCYSRRRQPRRRGRQQSQLRGRLRAIDFLGEALVDLGAQPQVVTVTLDASALARASRALSGAARRGRVRLGDHDGVRTRLGWPEEPPSGPGPRPCF
jgi:predicted amidohydrolase